MGGLNAETAGNLLSGGQDIYNMVEDNKNLRDNYKQDHQRLLHEQQLNREKKTNILEQNLAAQWHGVTYKEDKPALMASIEKMIAEGKYPRNLWA